MADEPRRRRKKTTRKNNEDRPLCGLVMPISEIGGLSADHWLDVKTILTDALSVAGFDSKLVSDGGAAEVIHKRIVQNLYDCPMVVADISCLNPNVMFELGMRLTFDKPVVIVKDDKTKYPFDTGPIEYVRYRRDLRYLETERFKEELGEKVTATLEASQVEGHSTFLSHFGTFKVVEPQSETVSADTMVLDKLDEISRRMIRMESEVSRSSSVVAETTTTGQNSQRVMLWHAITKNAAERAFQSGYDSILNMRQGDTSTVNDIVETAAQIAGHRLKSRQFYVNHSDLVREIRNLIQDLIAEAGIPLPDNHDRD